MGWIVTLPKIQMWVFCLVDADNVCENEGRVDAESVPD